MIWWIDCPGQGCSDELLSSGSVCSSTTAQTYLTCPCSLGWGCSTLFSELLFQGFFDFHSEAASSPLHCWPRVVPGLHLHFQHLHNLALLQKEVLSCTLCSCSSSCQYLCVFVLVWAFVWLHRGLAWGHDLAGGLKRQVWSCHRWRKVPSVRTLGLFCPAGIAAWKCCIS